MRNTDFALYLPTLKIESDDFPDSGYSGPMYISKSFKNTVQDNLKTNLRYRCPN